MAINKTIKGELPQPSSEWTTLGSPPSAAQTLDPTTAQVQLPVQKPTNFEAFLDTAQSVGSVLLDEQPNYRAAYGITNRNRQIISWRLPNGSAVQMYINPTMLKIVDSKQITPTRTKGGFIVQYWGANLTEITLSGTTGSSGIEGIELLYDIYNSENRGFDLIAAQIAAEMEAVNSKSFSVSGGSSANASTLIESVAKDIHNRNFLLRPSLAAMATSVVMVYQGVQYKGFFKSMDVTESAEKIGLFDYSIGFTATEKRGKRKNFLAWHKTPIQTGLSSQLLNGVANSLRSVVGLATQPPTTFHPENAPLSFGGNSFSADLGIVQDPARADRQIFI